MKFIKYAIGLLINCFQNGVRDRTDITYKTSIGVIFGVKKYAERLEKIAEKK